jgi:hypothetical protein
MKPFYVQYTFSGSLMVSGIIKKSHKKKVFAKASLD